MPAAPRADRAHGSLSGRFRRMVNSPARGVPCLGERPAILRAEVRDGRPVAGTRQTARCRPSSAGALVARSGRVCRLRPPGRWSGLLFGSAAVATGASAWWYRRFLGDYARSLAVATHGSLEVTVNQLVVRHTGVLSGSVAIPWASVRAVCVDHGSRPAHAGPGASGQPGSRFPLRPADDEAGKDDEEGGSSGQGPTALFTCEKLGRKQTGTRIPLLSAAPVVPNVLVLVDPAVELAWHYPFVASPFNPPRGIDGPPGHGRTPARPRPSLQPWPTRLLLPPRSPRTFRCATPSRQTRPIWPPTASRTEDPRIPISRSCFRCRSTPDTTGVSRPPKRA